ncbi:hypothetical protein B296_00045890 [Ensete ventricosum]|uniref:Uncharacterized protein n=1 Tax=Ensete ventricosum TaxID=4639 RepID=A0A426Y9X0_ENSVE|nr:hypothetical protein B296_00045890 [Ensete ventricosum]
MLSNRIVFTLLPLIPNRQPLYVKLRPPPVRLSNDSKSRASINRVVLSFLRYQTTTHPTPPPTSLPTASASSPTATLGASSQPSVPFNHESKAEQPLAPITRCCLLLLSPDLISGSAPSNRQSDRYLFFLPIATTAVATQPRPSPSIVAAATSAIGSSFSEAPSPGSLP